MPPDRQPEDVMLLLGEIRGQLREMVHTSNNTGMKVDGLVREVSEIKGMASTIASLENRLSTAEDDIDDLKTDRERRRGAVGAVEWISRIGPWMLSTVLAVLAYVGWIESRP